MTVMNIGNYAHGNQPIRRMIYLYNYADTLESAIWLRQVMDRMYTPGPDGYCGERGQRTDLCLVCFSQPSNCVVSRNR